MKKDRKKKTANDPGGTIYPTAQPEGGSSAIEGYESTSPKITNEEAEAAKEDSYVSTQEDAEWREETDEEQKKRD